MVDGQKKVGTLLRTLIVASRGRKSPEKTTPQPSFLLSGG